MRKGRQGNRGGRITVILLGMCFLIRTLRYVSYLGLYYQSFFICLFFFVQATSALAGLLEEDSIATDESKLIDNAWRGAEVFFPLTSLFRPWVGDHHECVNIEQFSIEDRKDRIALALLCSVIALRNTYHPLS